MALTVSDLLAIGSGLCGLAALVMLGLAEWQEQRQARREKGGPR